MATIQLGNTKVANKLMSYAEKRAEIREGVNCPSEYAKAQFKATRELWDKNNGIQAHHVIQSFKPNEVSPEQANEVGRELAKEIAPGHEVMVYTHADKAHVHNHIVINSVNFEDGSKYQSSKKDLYNIREKSDNLCRERGLSVLKEHEKSPLRHTLAEQGILERGETSWKEEIRSVIDHEKEHSTNYVEFKNKLQEHYGIEVKERGKNITFTHPDNNRKVRGSRLGNEYEKETIKHGFDRQAERSQERGNTDLSNEQQRGSERAERVAEANERLERPHEGLHQNEHGQEFRSKDDVRPRDNQHQDDKQASHDRNAFDINEAREALERQSRDVAKGFDRFTRNDEPERGASASTNEHDKQANRGQTDRDKQHDKERNAEHEQEKSAKLERSVSKDIDYGLER